MVATIHKPTRGFGIAIRLVGWPEGVYTSLRPTRRGSSRHFSFAVEDEPTPAPDQDDGSRLAAPGPLPPKRRRMFTIRPTERPTGSTFSLANLRNLFVRQLTRPCSDAVQSSSDSGFSIHDADDVRLLSYVDKSSLMSTDTHGAIEINDGALRQSGFDVPLELLVAVTLAVVDVTIDAEAYEAAQADLRE